MKNFLMSICAIFLMGFEAHALKVYFVSNYHSRDHNQAWGIVNAFKSLSPMTVSLEDVNAEKTSSLELKDKIEKDLSKEKVVVIGAGEGGLTGITDLTKDPNLVICLVGSTALPQYKDRNLLAKVDFIALPIHTAPDIKEALGEKLFETVNVVHNHHPDMTTFDEHQKELPPADIYFGVVLGGDIVTPTQEVKRFTEEDVTRLSTYVIAKANELKERGMTPGILVLNTAQTGRYDQNMQEQRQVHREGKSDPITELFAKQLADEGIEYKVFDFQYETPENQQWVRAYNAFDLVAGAVRTTKGKMIVPGESTRILSETIDVMPVDAIDTMPPGKALVYTHTAMGDIHKTQVDHQHGIGGVSILENYEDIIPASDKMAGTTSASKAIAHKLKKLVFAQTPWSNPASLYRRTKQEENSKKDKEEFIKQIQTE